MAADNDLTEREKAAFVFEAMVEPDIVQEPQLCAKWAPQTMGREKYSLSLWRCSRLRGHLGEHRANTVNDRRNSPRYVWRDDDYTPEERERVQKYLTERALELELETDDLEMREARRLELAHRSRFEIFP